MKLTSKHIGQTVWLVPEGNEVRRGTSGGALAQARYGRVVEMRRTKGILEIEGFHTPFTVKPERSRGDYIETTCNGGYLVFATQEEVQAVKEAAPLRSKIERALYTLPADKILAMADIAGVR